MGLIELSLLPGLPVPSVFSHELASFFIRWQRSVGVALVLHVPRFFPVRVVSVQKFLQLLRHAAGEVVSLVGILQAVNHYGDELLRCLTSW